MTIRGWNPLGIDNTIALNGDDPFGDDAQDALDTLMSAMERMPQHSRVTVFQVLTDFFCPYCGVEQPEGDCQCRKAAE